MAPVVHGLENKYGEHIIFVYLDIDDPATQALQQELGYDYRWRPFIFFVDGQGQRVGDVFIGAQDPNVLEQALQQFLIEQSVFSGD